MIALALLSTAVVSATIDIPTGDTAVASWGPGHGSYGQVFTVPNDDSFMLTFTFHILSLNDSFPYVSQIYRWSLDRPTGPALFTSDVRQTPPPSNAYTAVTFSPQLPVLAAQQYIAILTNQPGGVSLGAPPISVGGQTTLKSGDPYGGGYFTFAAGNPETGNWSRALLNYDAVFQAEFAAVAVPEPMSVTTFAGLAACAITLTRLSKQRGATPKKSKQRRK